MQKLYFFIDRATRVAMYISLVYFEFRPLLATFKGFGRNSLEFDQALEMNSVQCSPISPIVAPYLCLLKI